MQYLRQVLLFCALGPSAVSCPIHHTSVSFGHWRIRIFENTLNAATKQWVRGDYRGAASGIHHTALATGAIPRNGRMENDAGRMITENGPP
jgi:hypothetical protein